MSTPATTPPTMEEVVRQMQIRIQLQDQKLVQAEQQINRMTLQLSSQPKSSPQPVSQPSPTIHLSSASIPSKPDLFDGDRSKVSPIVWLFEVERYFDAVSITDDQKKVQFVSAQLRGTASTWWMSQMQMQSPSCTSWDEFKKAFNANFFPIEAAETARTVLYNLKQQGSVSHYISLFRLQLHQIPDMSAADQLALFRRGLINDIAWKLNIQHPKTLQEAMESAHRIELENQQQRFSRPRNFPQQQRSNPFQPWRYASQTPIYTPVFPNSSNQSYTGSAPMEISQMENAPQHEQQQDSATQGMINAMGMYNKKGGNGYRHSQQKQQFRSFSSPSNLSKLTPEERSKLFAEGRCFRCRQSGHQSSQCPLNVSSSHSKNFNARQ